MSIEFWRFTDELSQGQTQYSYRGRRNNKKDVTCCSKQEQKTPAAAVTFSRSLACSPGSAATLPSQQDSGQLM